MFDRYDETLTGVDKDEDGPYIMISDLIAWADDNLDHAEYELLMKEIEE